VTDILDKITTAKRLEVEQYKIELPIEKLRRHLDAGPEREPHLFEKALSDRSRINIIAELKKGSPSKGIMVEDFDPEDLARKYADGGAAALSVLTDHRFFFGSFENLTLAREAAQLPVLSKDFILDAYQILFARYHGADAVLLIARLHSAGNLKSLLECAQNMGMDCLVETHTPDEVNLAVDCGAGIIGVNNRNLADFSIDLSISEKLAELIPQDATMVTESGLSKPADISRLRKAGYNCFLIGQALVQADDPATLLKSLRSA